MKMTVNGKDYECEQGTTLLALVKELKLDESALVAEHNREVVPSVDFSSVVLKEADRVELIEFVAGG